MFVRPPNTTFDRVRELSEDSSGRLPAVSDRLWMEQLMIKGARFSRSEFARLFLGERRRLAAGVLWATYDTSTGTRYFIVDERDDFELPPGTFVGIPYVTELGSFTRETARNLIGRRSIDQLDRPVLLPAEPTGTVLDLEILEDDSLWSAAAPSLLRTVGFGQTATGALLRRYHYIDQPVEALLVPRPNSQRYAVKLGSKGEHAPLPVINELLLDIARALVPGQTRGYPMVQPVHMGTLCTRCGDSIDEGERAFIYERPPDSSLRLAALHQSCRPFSLAARYLSA